MGFTYRKVSIEEADKMMDYADENHIEYDIWNSADMLMGSQIVEIGFRNWEIIEKALSNE